MENTYRAIHIAWDFPSSIIRPYRTSFSDGLFESKNRNHILLSANTDIPIPPASDFPNFLLRQITIQRLLYFHHTQLSLWKRQIFASYSVSSHNHILTSTFVSGKILSYRFEPSPDASVVCGCETVHRARQIVIPPILLKSFFFLIILHFAESCFWNYFSEIRWPSSGVQRCDCSVPPSTATV